MCLVDWEERARGIESNFDKRHIRDRRACIEISFWLEQELICLFAQIQLFPELFSIHDESLFAQRKNPFVLS